MMREFDDGRGGVWVASARRRSEGEDYKGRYHFVARPKGGDEARGVELLDVRWNSEKAATLALQTMSMLELRRRLRTALGRRGTLGGETAV